MRFYVIFVHIIIKAASWDDINFRFQFRTEVVYPTEGRLNVFTALGHMLMVSAQRWLDNQCCRCVLPCPDYKTPISGDCSDLTV